MRQSHSYSPQSPLRSKIIFGTNLGHVPAAATSTDVVPADGGASDNPASEISGDEIPDSGVASNLAEAKATVFAIEAAENGGRESVEVILRLKTRLKNVAGFEPRPFIVSLVQMSSPVHI